MVNKLIIKRLALEYLKIKRYYYSEYLEFDDLNVIELVQFSDKNWYAVVKYQTPLLEYELSISGLVYNMMGGFSLIFISKNLTTNNIVRHEINLRYSCRNPFSNTINNDFYIVHTILNYCNKFIKKIFIKKDNVVKFNLNDIKINNTGILSGDIRILTINIEKDNDITGCHIQGYIWIIDNYIYLNFIEKDTKYSISQKIGYKTLSIPITAERFMPAFRFEKFD